jgi:hypothetical protein
VDRACVGRADDGLHFGNVQRGPKGEIWYVEASLLTAGLEASLGVSSHYATGFDDLVAFFCQLASDWRGWRGERVYESMEHELRLAATHDGHVRLAVQLLQSSLPNGWSANAVMQLDPGEELTRIADELAVLLSSSL